MALLQIEGVDHAGEIVGERVVVVSAAGHAGAAVATAIERDAAEPLLDDVDHGMGPDIGAVARAVHEYHGVALAPVLEEQRGAIGPFDVRADARRLACATLAACVAFIARPIAAAAVPKVSALRRSMSASFVEGK